MVDKLKFWRINGGYIGALADKWRKRDINIEKSGKKGAGSFYSIAQ